MSEKESHDNTQDLLIEELKVENQKVYEELTNKNKEYMFDLNQRLKEGNVSEEDRVKQLNDMLTTAAEEQSKGVTARQLYGTVTDQSRYLLEEKPRQKSEETAGNPVFEQNEIWKLYVDGGLLIGSIFGIMNGLGALFVDSSEATGTGFVSLLMNYILGGLLMLIITKTAPTEENNSGVGRYLIVSFLVIFLWMLIMWVVQVFISPTINFYIPSNIVLITGIATLLIRWLFKRIFDVKGTLF